VKKILVVGQTPPPYHGQAMMINRLVKADFTKISIYHIRMSYSENLNKIGKFSLHKVTHLLYLILKTYTFRFRYNIKTLYYPPAGPDLNPIIRDIIFLFFVRPLFKETIFHFRAAGLSEYIGKANFFIRYLACVAYSKPNTSIQLSSRNPPDGKYFNSERIEIVPNGIEDENTASLTKQLKPVIHIISLGIIQQSKGIEDIITAINTIIKTNTNVKVDVVGGFCSVEYEKYIKKLVQTYSLEDYIEFHGVKVGIDKTRLLLQADILCFPSYYESESFGNVLLEAMQFKLPVVATEWRGIPDIVIDSTTGYIVPIKSPQKIAEKLLLLINNSDLRIKFGENARGRYLDYYTIETHLKNMENILAGVKT